MPRPDSRANQRWRSCRHDEKKWFPRLDGHAPEINLHAQLTQAGLDQVAFAYRYTPANHKHVMLEAGPERGRERLPIIRRMLT